MRYEEVLSRKDIVITMLIQFTISFLISVANNDDEVELNEFSIGSFSISAENFASAASFYSFCILFCAWKFKIESRIRCWMLHK